MDGMNEREVYALFEESGAMLQGHFLLSSGLHSDQYFEKFAVLQWPKRTEALCAELARRFAGDGIDVVVGPATGGILLAHEVGKALSVRSLFTEREGGRMALRRGFAIKEGERVLVVEDVVTTGGSVLEVLDVVREAGGTLVGVGLLVDRSGGTADFGVRTEALLHVSPKTYTPQECPLCRDGVPFRARGSKYTS